MDFGKNSIVNSDEVKDMQKHVDEIRDGKIKNFIFLALKEDGEEVSHLHCHGTIAAGLLQHALTDENDQYIKNKRGAELLKAFSQFHEDDD